MRKNNKVFVGDRIITNKYFKPFLANKDLFDTEGNFYKGTIIEIRDAVLNVAFDDELPFCHTLENRTDKINGYSLSFKEANLSKSVDIKDEKKRAFIGLIREINFDKMSQLPILIRSKEDSVRSYVATARELASQLLESETKIEAQNHELATLIKSKRTCRLNIDDVSVKYNKFRKNKKIKSVESIVYEGRKSVLITTNDLTYHRDDSIIGDFVLGAYKILIPLKTDFNVMCSNYKRHKDKSRYHHPCVSGFKLCLGDSVGAEVKKLRNESNIIGLTYLLILFLEKPDYEDPYCREEEFHCAQPVTMKPKLESDWFSEAYWNENETWDGAKFAEDFKKINSRD